MHLLFSFPCRACIWFRRTLPTILLFCLQSMYCILRHSIQWMRAKIFLYCSTHPSYLIVKRRSSDRVWWKDHCSLTIRPRHVKCLEQFYNLVGIYHCRIVLSSWMTISYEMMLFCSLDKFLIVHTVVIPVVSASLLPGSTGKSFLCHMMQPQVGGEIFCRNSLQKIAFITQL